MYHFGYSPLGVLNESFAIASKGQVIKVFYIKMVLIIAKYLLSVLFKLCIYLSNLSENNYCVVL
ncbi:hypothetical protein ACWF7H_28900, partial [Peribacillus butanolivorans]